MVGGARVGSTSWLERTRGPALERFPPGQEYPIASGRPVAAVDLQPLGRYEDVNDAARLAQDPTFRLIGSRKIWERGAALTSRLQSFETEVLTQEENLAGLAALHRGVVSMADVINCS